MRHTYSLYLQVEQDLENSILSGGLAPGHKISSVRSLAAIYQVNPYTVQRALSLLRKEQLIELIKGRFFVTRDSSMIGRCREKKVQFLVLKLHESLSALGYSWKDLWNETASSADAAG